jgi:hypothetical protein
MDEIEISEDILKKCILDSENLLSSIRMEIHQVKPFPNFCMVWYEVFDNSKSSKFMGRVDKGDYMNLLNQKEDE